MALGGGVTRFAVALSPEYGLAERALSGIEWTRLDELPQLYNVLIGETSFVGPRPLLAADQPGNGRRRLSVRPGLTGLAQVHGGRSISPDDTNAFDLWYIRKTSYRLDTEILLRTVAVLIKGEWINHSMLCAAREALEHFEGSDLALRSLESKRAWTTETLGFYVPPLELQRQRRQMGLTTVPLLWLYFSRTLAGGIDFHPACGSIREWAAKIDVDVIKHVV